MPFPCLPTITPALWLLSRIDGGPSIPGMPVMGWSPVCAVQVMAVAKLLPSEIPKAVTPSALRPSRTEFVCPGITPIGEKVGGMARAAGPASDSARRAIRWGQCMRASCSNAGASRLVVDGSTSGGEDTEEVKEVLVVQDTIGDTEARHPRHDGPGGREVRG